MKTVVAHIQTVGLMAFTPKSKKPFLAAVAFDRYDDETVKAYVISRNGSELQGMSKTITRAKLQNMPDNPFDDLVFARAAFALFDLTIQGDKS